jgi:ABC-type sulfate/molybdate transport systems ATPase subunit
LITHDQNIAEHAKRILILRDGKIYEEARAGAVRDAQGELDFLPADSAPVETAAMKGGAR